MSFQKGYLSIFLDSDIKNFSSSYASIGRRNAFVNDVVYFHYSPTSIFVSSSSRYDSQDTSGAAVKQYEYKGKNATIISLRQLLFNDFLNDDINDIGTQKASDFVNSKIITAMNNPEFSFREDSPAVLAPKNGAFRRNVSDSINQLLEWVSPSGTGTTPPLLELGGVTPGRFICYISDLQIRREFWERRTKRLLRAWVDLKLTEHIMSQSASGVEKDGGLGFLDYRYIAVEELKRTTTVPGLGE